VAGALLLAGVGAATRSPRLSTAFVAIAVLTIVVTHPWMIGAVAPAGALLLAAVAARTRRLRRLAAS
jgi:Flp pilus assembly protein TadB